MSENPLKYSLNCQFYAEKVKCDPNDFHFVPAPVYMDMDWMKMVGWLNGM